MPKVVGLEQLVGKLGVVDPLSGRHSCLHTADGQSWKACALSNAYLLTYLSRASIWPTRTCLPIVLRKSTNWSLLSQSPFVKTCVVPNLDWSYPRETAYLAALSKNRVSCSRRLLEEDCRVADSIESRSVVRSDGSPTAAVACPIWERKSMSAMLGGGMWSSLRGRSNGVRGGRSAGDSSTVAGGPHGGSLLWGRRRHRRLLFANPQTTRAVQRAYTAAGVNMSQCGAAGGAPSDALHKASFLQLVHKSGGPSYGSGGRQTQGWTHGSQ